MKTYSRQTPPCQQSLDGDDNIERCEARTHLLVSQCEQPQSLSDPIAFEPLTPLHHHSFSWDYHYCCISCRLPDHMRERHDQHFPLLIACGCLPVLYTISLIAEECV